MFAGLLLSRKLEQVRLLTRGSGSGHLTESLISTVKFYVQPDHTAQLLATAHTEPLQFRVPAVTTVWKERYSRTVSILYKRELHLPRDWVSNKVHPKGVSLQPIVHRVLIVKIGGY